MQTTCSTNTLGDNILTQQVVFTKKDILNIVSWFDEQYDKKDQVPKDQAETYLKVAKYFIIDERSLS
tara:strand:+ start:5381 stop:5581 length:201 start_codon:yes stop_codon:yes gene_type:complete